MKFDFAAVALGALALLSAFSAAVLAPFSMPLAAVGIVLSVVLALVVVQRVAPKALRVTAVAAAAVVIAGSLIGTALAQVYPYVAGDTSGILGNYPLFPYGLRASVLNQQAAGNYANRSTLATGVVSITFAKAYSAVPICVASEESTTGHYVKITAISATAVTFTSDVTTSNSDPIDWACFGNPT